MNQRQRNTSRDRAVCKLTNTSAVIFEPLEDRMLMSSTADIVVLRPDHGNGVTTGPVQLAFVMQEHTEAVFKQGQEQTSILALILPGTPHATAAPFTGQIDWGDQHSSPLSITPDANGGFDVTGTHLFQLSGNYAATLTINGLNVTVSGHVLLVVQSAFVLQGTLSAASDDITSGYVAGGGESFIMNTNGTSYVNTTTTYQPANTSVAAQHTPIESVFAPVAPQTAPERSVSPPLSSLSPPVVATHPAQQNRLAVLSISNLPTTLLATRPMVHPLPTGESVPTHTMMSAAGFPPPIGDPGTFSGELTLGHRLSPATPEDPMYDAQRTIDDQQHVVIPLAAVRHGKAAASRKTGIFQDQPVLAFAGKTSRPGTQPRQSPGNRPARMSNVVACQPPLAAPVGTDRALAKYKFILAGLLAMTTALALPFVGRHKA